MQIMNVKKNTTGTKMLVVIGIVKSFIMSGKLRIKGELPLNELLDKNAQMGGDLNQLLADITLHVGNTKECGFDFEFSDEDLREMMEESELSINDLPACDIEMIIAHKLMPKKNYGDISLTLKASLADEQNSPSLALSLNLSGQNLKYIPSVLKNQFIGQNRISEIISNLAVAQLLKSMGVKKTDEKNLVNLMRYKNTKELAGKEIKKKSKEEIWELAEIMITNTFTSDKKIPEFSVTIGIHIKDKLTLSVDFNQKAKKK